MIRIGRAALEDELADCGGHALAAANSTEFSTAEIECEENPAALQQLIRLSLSQRYLHRSVLEAAIAVAKQYNGADAARAAAQTVADAAGARGRRRTSASTSAQTELIPPSDRARLPKKRRRAEARSCLEAQPSGAITTSEENGAGASSAESAVCFACERELPRAVKGAVCADCVVCPPWGSAGFRRGQGAVDFEAVEEPVEEACAGNQWIKQEQAPHVSDVLAHLAAASFASPERCFEVPASYDFLPCEFPHPNGHMREPTRMVKSLIDALGPQAAHKIFGCIVWRFRNTQEALVALQPLLQKFPEGEDLQALRRGVEAMYLADPAKVLCRSHLFSTGDAIRRTGGHASWRAAVLGSLEKWWEAAQHAAAILEDPATTPASWHLRFQREVLPKMSCFGPYWSKYVYGDVGEHVAAEKADLLNYTKVGPSCEYWLRFMGLPLQRGKVQQQGLEALRELRDIVNKVNESGRHCGLEAARARAQLAPLTVYGVQVQSCETKRGFKMAPRVAAARMQLWGGHRQPRHAEAGAGR